MLTFSYRDDTMEEEMDAFDAGDSLLDRKPKNMRGGGILGNILRIFGRNQVSTADQSSTKNQTSGAAGGGGGFAAFSAALSKQQQQQPVGVKQGGGASTFAQLVLQASKVDKANKMLVEVAHTEAPNGKADFAMEHASVSNIGYKKLSDSCTAAEYADGKGEGCVCLILVCANVEDMKKAVKGLELGMNHYHRHSNTNQDLYKKGGLFNKKKPKWLRGTLTASLHHASVRNWIVVHTIMTSQISYPFCLLLSATMVLRRTGLLSSLIPSSLSSPTPSEALS